MRDSSCRWNKAVPIRRGSAPTIRADVGASALPPKPPRRSARLRETGPIDTVVPAILRRLGRPHRPSRGLSGAWTNAMESRCVLSRRSRRSSGQPGMAVRIETDWEHIRKVAVHGFDAGRQSDQRRRHRRFAALRGCAAAGPAARGRAAPHRPRCHDPCRDRSSHRRRPPAPTAPTRSPRPASAGCARPCRCSRG